MSFRGISCGTGGQDRREAVVDVCRRSSPASCVLASLVATFSRSPLVALCGPLSWRMTMTSCCWSMTNGTPGPTSTDTQDGRRIRAILIAPAPGTRELGFLAALQRRKERTTNTRAKAGGQKPCFGDALGRNSNIPWPNHPRPNNLKAPFMTARDCGDE